MSSSISKLRGENCKSALGSLLRRARGGGGGGKENKKGKRKKKEQKIRARLHVRGMRAEIISSAALQPRRARARAHADMYLHKNRRDHGGG